MLQSFKNILVAYDGSDLSAKALEYAKKFASESEDISLHVVTVYTPPASMGSYGVYNDAFLEELKSETEDALKEATEDLADLANPTDAHVLEGATGRSIVDFADEHDIDLIIIGSRGLSGFKEALLGSVSHHVVQKAHCPVFVVK